VSYKDEGWTKRGGVIIDGLYQVSEPLHTTGVGVGLLHVRWAVKGATSQRVDLTAARCIITLSSLRVSQSLGLQCTR